MITSNKQRALTSGTAVVHVGNSQCKIAGDAPTDSLVQALSYQDSVTAEFLRSGAWGKLVDNELKELQDKMDGANSEKARSRAENQLRRARRQANTVCLYDIHDKTFPTPLLMVALRIIRDSGISYSLEDEREKPGKTLKLEYHNNGHEQRDYQDRAVEVGMHCRCGTFAMATNAGKTSVMLRLIQEKGYKTLILVQRQELMFQIAEAIEEHLKYKPGLAGAGKFELKDITVAIVNTAHMHSRELEDYGFNMVFVDEGHHAASRIHYTVLKRVKPYAIYSMTGTDFRNSENENMILSAAFGGTFYRITNQFMVENGYSARIKAQILRCRQDIHPSAIWMRVYEVGILQSIKRSKLIVAAVKKHADSGKVVLVLTDQTGHGQTIYDLLTSSGLDTRFMHGKRSRADRDAARLDFKGREFQVLVGTTLYDEGIDFPTLDVIVFAGGKRAKGKVLQRLGRGQRRGFHVDGSRKDECVLIDVYDHGHAYLKRHSLKRLKVMHEAGVVLPQEYLKLLKKEGYLYDQLQ